jgi:branched-chain amino acid transport system permease protein
MPLTGVNDSIVLTASTILMWIIVASSWNFISGFTGYVDFGHGVFFGIGGYTTAILVAKSGLAFGPSVPIAALACVLFALVIGYPLLRLRGVYFSIAMLGAFLAVREVVLIATPLTGGARGITLPPEVDRNFFYYLFLGGALLTVALAWLLRRSQFGSSLLAIKDDEAGAEARGINTTLLKLTVFCLSAGITGAVGACWAYQMTFIDPGIMFRDTFLINVAIIATLGGLGTVWGPVIGSVVFLLVRDTLWANQGNSFLVVFGVFLMLLVLFMPEGIVGTIQRGERTVLGRWIRRLRYGDPDQATTMAPASTVAENQG